MADDYGFTPGSGKTRGADEISGVLYNRNKLIYGADGVNSGDVSISNGYPCGMSQTNYGALVEITSVTSSYQSCGLSNVSTGRALRVHNDTDCDIRGSWDAGTTMHHLFPAKSERIVPIKAGATQLHQRYDSAVYTAGKLRIEVLQ